MGHNISLGLRAEAEDFGLSSDLRSLEQRDPAVHRQRRVLRLGATLRVLVGRLLDGHVWPHGLAQGEEHPATIGPFPDWLHLKPLIDKLVNEFACPMRYPSEDAGMLAHQKNNKYEPPIEPAKEPQKTSKKRPALSETAPNKLLAL